MLQIAETAEERATKRTLIETTYCGSYPKFQRTKGEAFYNAINNSWYYRPFSQQTIIEFGEEKEGFFTEVSAKDLECSNDKGWLKGEYVGDRPSIPRQGKAYWNDVVEKWNYKPITGNREFLIKEGNFILKRDEDVFDK